MTATSLYGKHILLARGLQDRYIIDDPENAHTYFRDKYTPQLEYDVNIVDQSFENALSFNQKSMCIISNTYGDFLKNVSLRIELPAIHKIISEHDYAIKWHDRIGYAMIDYIEIEIGDKVISRIHGQLMNAWYELNKYHLDTLTQASFADSIQSEVIYTPLPFWFGRSRDNMLPVCLLYNTEPKINIKLNPFNKCFIVEPSHYINVNEDICQYTYGDKIKSTAGSYIKFIRYNILNKRLYYTQLNYKPILKGHMLTHNGHTMTASDDSIDVTYKFTTPPDILSATLTSTYVNIPPEIKTEVMKMEEWRCVIDDFQYMNEQVVKNFNVNITLPFKGYIKEIIWLPRYAYNDKINDIYNTADDDGKSLIKTISMFANSHEVLTDFSSEYFNYVIPQYKHIDANLSTGKHVYSFALYPGEQLLTGFTDKNIKLSMVMDSSISPSNPVKILCYGIGLKEIAFKYGSIDYSLI